MHDSRPVRLIVFLFCLPFLVFFNWPLAGSTGLCYVKLRAGSVLVHTSRQGRKTVVLFAEVSPVPHVWLAPKIFYTRYLAKFWSEVRQRF